MRESAEMLAVGHRCLSHVAPHSSAGLRGHQLTKTFALHKTSQAFLAVVNFIFVETNGGSPKTHIINPGSHEYPKERLLAFSQKDLGFYDKEKVE